MKVHFHTVKLNYKLLICFIILLLVSSCIGIYTFTNASSYEEESIKLPIIMYHSILKDTSRSGKYIVTPSTLEADLQYIANNGYTTITMTDLIAYVYENSVLPEKPIIITFYD